MPNLLGGRFATLFRAVFAAALVSIAASALAEPEYTNWPNYQEGDFIITDYEFASD